MPYKNKEDRKKWDERHPNYMKDYLRKYRDPKKSSLYMKKWRENNPEKSKVYGKVSYSLRKGILVKDVCFVCKETKVEAHHEDYSKPLEVIWLCKTHHVIFDKNRRSKQ